MAVVEQLGQAAAGAAAGAAVQKGAQTGKSWLHGGKPPPTWMLLAGAAAAMAWLWVQHAKKSAANALQVGSYPTVTDPSLYGQQPGYASMSDLNALQQQVTGIAQSLPVLTPAPTPSSSPVAIGQLPPGAIPATSDLAGWYDIDPATVQALPGFVWTGSGFAPKGTPGDPNAKDQPGWYNLDPHQFKCAPGYVWNGVSCVPAARGGANPPMEPGRTATEQMLTQQTPYEPPMNAGGGPRALDGSLRLARSATLPEIAAVAYGDAGQWHRIYRANPWLDQHPGRPLPAGVSITIPA